MAIRKPSVSVTEAMRLAKGRSDEPLPRPPLPPPPGKELPAGTVSGGQKAPGTGRQSVPVEPVAPSSARPGAVARRIPTDGLFPEARPSEPKIQVFLSAPLPAAGVSQHFDILSRQYPEVKALQMVLRRALDDYEIRLGNGSYSLAPIDYPLRSPAGGIAIIQTSRMIPVRLVTVAREHFDPLGFESTRAFGRKLACAALASFFEAEEMKRK